MLREISTAPFLTVRGPTDRNFDICLPGPKSNPLKFRALSPSHDVDLANISYMEFFENIFIPKDADSDADVSIYTIEAKCCDGPNGELTTQVHAHTQVEYKGKISVGDAPKKEEKIKGSGLTFYIRYFCSQYDIIKFYWGM
ncbi:MAG: hypothetical protein HRU20_29910 [Pseudomonadales bacterium]|nr:hypothetical protein [Pseudomonadales bacterium]